MGTVAVVCLGALVLGFLLPSTWEAEAEITVAAAPPELDPWLAEAAGWLLWTPGPVSGVEATGPRSGAGSGYAWDDPGYGQGHFRLVAVEPGREIRYRVEVEGGSIVIEGALTLEALEPAPGGEPRTRIHWQESGDFGWNPLLSYLSGRMAELQGEQLAQSLATLRGLVEAEGTPEPHPEPEDEAALPRG